MIYYIFVLSLWATNPDSVWQMDQTFTNVAASPWTKQELDSRTVACWHELDKSMEVGFTVLEEDDEAYDCANWLL